MGIVLIGVLWVGIFFCTVNLFNTSYMMPSYTGVQTNPPLSSCLSSNPAAPTILQNDSALYETFNSLDWYYYRTGLAEAGKYQVIWVHPTDPEKYITLNAYSDSSYTNLIACTTDPFYYWVLLRPSLSQFIYAKALAGWSNPGYIEWEVVNRQLPLGSTVMGTLSGAEAIEAYQVMLSPNIYYNVNLTVPSGANFDLFIYYLAMGDADGGAGYSCIAGSGDGGVGEGEALIRRKLGVTGIGLVIVVWRSGAGTYQLTFEDYYGSNGSVPAFPFLPFIAVFIAILITYKKNEGRR
jgi:hypothetical protein